MAGLLNTYILFYKDPKFNKKTRFQKQQTIPKRYANVKKETPMNSKLRHVDGASRNPRVHVRITGQVYS